MSAQTPALYNDLTMRLDPAEIEVVDRIGFFHPDKAAALGRLIAVDGQRDPIKVVINKKGRPQPWRLVAGMHRLEGVKAEGLPAVWAIEVFGKPEDLADLESSENLHRRPLGPIERAKFVHALCEAATLRLARENGNLSQQQLAIKARWAKAKAGPGRVDQALQEEVNDTSDKMSSVYGWQESAADAMGLDKRTIQRSLRLYRMIIEPFPDLAEQLSRHPVVGENDKQLREIADVSAEPNRRRVIEMLLDDPELSADEARIRIGMDQPTGRAPTPFEKFTGQIDSGWARLTLEQRRRYVPKLAAMLNTPELRRMMLDALTGETGDA